MGVTKQQLFNTVQRIKAYVDSVAVGGNSSNFLAKDNTEEYTPTQDYHPATKQYVDNAKVNISQKVDNAIKQEHDGLYVPSVAKTSISTEEDNALVEKEDGLYVPSVAETNISTEENNAVVKKDDGIFVEDKTDAIQAISNKIENINRYQKYVNSDLGYYYIVHYDTASPAQGSYLIPAEIISNMDYESNGVVTLKKDHKYLVQGSIRTSSGACGVALRDIDNNRCYFRAFSYPQNASEKWSEQAMNGIIVPEADMRCVFVFEEVYSTPIPSRLDFTITEIGRETIVDPVEHINSESGIEDTPVGHIMSHMGKTAPAHYLICDGAEYNIIDYPHLTKHFTNEFGSVNYFGGDGVTTFAVPDLRGEFLRGTGTAIRDSGSGAEVGKHQDGTIFPRYYVYPNQITYRFNTNVDANGEQIWNGDKYIVSGDKVGSLAITGSTNTATETAANVISRPTNTSVLYCIKYEPTYCINVNGYIQKETILWDGSLMADCSYDVEKETVDYTINLSDDIFNYEEIIIKYCGYITFNDTRTSPLITSIRPNDLYNFGSSNSTDFMLPVDMFYATFCLWGYFSNEKTIKMNLKNVQNTSKSAMDTLEVYRVIGVKTSYKNNENTGNNSSENLELTDEEIEELVDKAYNEAIAEIEEVSP